MNIKKLFPEKKLTGKKIKSFLDKKMFYLVLVVCICVLGGTVYYSLGNSTEKSPSLELDKSIEEMNNPASSIVGKEVINKSLESVQSKKDIAKPTPAITAVPTIVSQEKGKISPQKTNDDHLTRKVPAKKSSEVEANAVSSNFQATKEHSFVMPVFGQVCVEFSKDKLVFSKTLEEWSTHCGIDVACEKGSAVKVVADGYVSEVKNDPKLGETIIVQHTNGLKTVYANLASCGMVSTNQKLIEGDIIGCTGSTAIFESAEQPHLHFEVLRNNKPIDPAIYLPKE